MQGKFISFEGPDGAGKTSVVQQILEDLRAELGDQVMYIREPGGTHISEEIRQVLFDGQNTNMDGRTEALLFAAARRQLMVEKIIPGLQAGKIILSDRFVDSSIAYQGAGRKLGEDEIWRINQYAIDGVMPQLTIYLDIESKLGLTRISKHRANQVNRLDREALAFHQTVRKSYLRLLAKYPERIKKIDASQSLPEVIQATKLAIHENFPDLF